MKKNSLRFNIWLYFVLFSLIILVSLWIIQVLCLDKYYEWTKNKSVKMVVNKVIDLYDDEDRDDQLDLLSYNKDVCIEIFDDSEEIYTSGNISHGCLLNNHDKDNAKKRISFVNGDDDTIKYTIVNPFYESKILVYGIKLDNTHYAFISTSLEPVNSTIDVLTDQYKFVTVGVFILSFIIAYFLSLRISKPIIKISEKSRLMGRGNYDITFEESDILEIKELAHTLNTTAKELAKTDELRRELMANVSHDLKTPLTLIQANAEMVRDITYNNKEKRNNNLNVIINEVDRLNLLVKDILDVSAYQAKTISLNIEKFNLQDLMNNVMTKYKVLIDRDGYTINLNMTDNYVVKADIKRIEQVIYNLVNNAINYTGDDKVININVKNGKKRVLIEVIDTGCGIDKDKLMHIWDKYYKIDKKYHRVAYGTGLGLSIVKNILELHHFKYGVESKKNSGTKFYFYIDKA
ncbi:MAG: HAMP domain-containing histidine kinase [Bacilli bacterium]|nr:HAMP domain-containing histidine kinase [Bacilli bacterium]